MKLNEFAGSWPHTRPVLKLTFYGWALTFVLALAFTPGTAMAQLPIMIIDDAGVFEGNSGTTILKLPVRFVGTQNQMVTGVVSAIPLTGAGFNTPTGGAQCGGSVDFQPFSEVPFTILPNTPNGTLTVNITICGNATIEPDEQIFVSFSRVVGADCTLEGTCNGVGTIINDDGPPSIRINDITVSTLERSPKKRHIYGEPASSQLIAGVGPLCHAGRDGRSGRGVFCRGLLFCDFRHADHSARYADRHDSRYNHRPRKRHVFHGLVHPGGQRHPFRCNREVHH